MGICQGQPIDRPAAQTLSGDPGARSTPTFDLLQEQLGLRLESARGAVDVWVIESVERPSEN